jgi:ABC-type nitrate/sulfonate/bicarbonate transport system substrate-binding protein
MSFSTAYKAARPEASLDKLWFTRCGVPTATGLAYRLGWLKDEFAADGFPFSSLQEEGPNSDLSGHHYDHELAGLIREGGNMLAIGARAQGAPSRLIGLTWIDEGQSIIVRPGSGISEPGHLKGLRVALPAFNDFPILKPTRGRSIQRGMALHGFKGALSSAGLTLEDVRFVETGPLPQDRTKLQDGSRNSWRGLAELAAGEVDAVYVKGAAAADSVKKFGLVVGIDLDKLPNRRFRVNNGTPRPITVHQDLLENHFDLVARFLYQSLRAAEWAKSNLDGVNKVLQSETSGSAAGVAATYRDGFHRTLHPDLSPERLDLFRQQKDFLFTHGFLDRDFDLDAWADSRPLAAAWKLIDERKQAGIVGVDLNNLPERSARIA